MNSDETIKCLKAHKATLAQRFGVTDLALFGSAARDETGPNCALMWSGKVSMSDSGMTMREC
jgi:predicted nucleotidyltransferase